MNINIFKVIMSVFVCMCVSCRVSTELCYKKQPWGLQDFIERNAWSGLDECFRHLG